MDAGGPGGIPQVGPRMMGCGIGDGGIRDGDA